MFCQEQTLMTRSNFVKSILPAAVLGFLALGLTTTSAFAAVNNTASITVSATVANICSVTASPMAFGTLIAAANQTTSTIGVTCTTGDTYSVALSAGNSGVETARYMKGTGTHQLPYALTSVSYSGSNWGTTGAQPGTGTGTNTNFTVYGQITAAQALAAPVDATYSDTISVTVTY
jgi:spore coat protein U-like protein